MKRRILCGLLLLCLLLSLLPTAALGSEGAEGPEEPGLEEPEKPEEEEPGELEEPEPQEEPEPEARYQTAAGGGWSTGTLAEACANVYAGGGVIVLRDIELEEGVTVTKSMTILSEDPDAPCKITYSSKDRGDYLLTVSLPAYTPVFLQDIILDGGSEEGATAHSELVGVSSHPTYGELVLREGAVLQNNDNVDVSEGGGGLRVMSGMAYLEAGSVIQNCRGKAGGGAAVATQYSTLYLQGGTIRDCEASFGGGIYIGEKGRLSMNAGSSVCRNQAKTKADGEGGHGGGIYVENGILTLAGGAVQDNRAQYGGGMYFDSAQVQVGNLSVTGNFAEIYAGGIFSSPRTAIGIGAPNAKFLPNVTGNKSGEGYFDNVYLDGSAGDTPSAPDEMATQPMALINALGDTASIGISRWVRPDEDHRYRVVAVPANRYTITDADLAKFHSDDPKYVTMLHDGNIVITTADVIFDNQGHGPTPHGQQIGDTRMVVEPTEEMTERGYTFGGWYEEEACETLWDFEENTVTEIGDDEERPLMTLYAKWELNLYEIVYELEGGENPESNPHDYTVKSEDINLAPPTREGYRFLRWELVEVKEDEKMGTIPLRSARSARASDADIPAGSIGKRTFKAIWKELPTYTVTYTDGVDDDTIFEDKVYDMPEGADTPRFEPAPEREGYTFTGWSPEWEATVTQTVTYVAQWEKKKPRTCTVTYTDGVDGEIVFEDKVYDVPEGADTPRFEPAPEREGYTFTGWSPEWKATVKQTVTYIAQWEKKKPRTCTVTYTDGVDGEIVFEDQVYDVPEGADTPAFVGIPTREGYTFTGWSPEREATVTETVTYVAQWKKKDIPALPDPPAPPAGDNDDDDDDESPVTPPAPPEDPAPPSTPEPSSPEDPAPPAPELTVTPEPDPVPKPAPDPVPRTGDPTHTVLWAGCALTSLAGIVLLLKPRRRRR